MSTREGPRLPLLADVSAVMSVEIAYVEGMLSVWDVPDERIGESPPLGDQIIPLAPPPRRRWPPT
jgi:hypothetical protein